LAVVAAVLAGAGVVVGVVQVQAMVALPSQAAHPNAESTSLKPYLQLEGLLFNIPLSQLPVLVPSASGAQDKGPLGCRSKYLPIISQLSSIQRQYTITMACISLSP